MTKIKMNLSEVIPYMTQIKKELEEEEQQFYNRSSAAGGVPRRRVLEAQRNLEELAMANSMRMEAMNREKPVKKFTCKTCNRDFSSFQALGGHRAGHKRLPRVVVEAVAGENGVVVQSGFRVSSGFKSRRMHRCSICGVEFAMGQALGGHMRRHSLDDQFAVAGGGGGSDCTGETTLDMLRMAADGGAWEDGGGISGDKGLDLDLNPYDNGGLSANKGLDLDLNLNLYDNYMKFFD